MGGVHEAYVSRTESGGENCTGSRAANLDESLGGKRAESGGDGGGLSFDKLRHGNFR